MTTALLGGTLPLSEGDASKVATYNEYLQNVLEAVVAGSISKSVAGSSNVTLTNDEARNKYFVFTGTLTGNIQVRFPASGGAPRHFVVYNNTAGAFSLTLVVTGGSGVAITQGEIRHFVIDGTAVVAVDTTAGTFTAVAAQAVWARVYNNAVQSINNATDTVLNFNSERADTDTIHDTSSDNSRLTCKTAGIYMIVGNIGFAANSTGFRVFTIKLNGTTAIGSSAVQAAPTTPTRVAVTTVYPLAVNDYVELSVHQTSGGALNTEQGNNYSPEFMMVRLGGS